MNLNKLGCLLIGASLAVTSCKHEPPVMPKTEIDPASTQYPLEVANIIIKNCATAGCHNEASYSGAGGLRLDDWQYLFDGGSNGAVAVPYSPEYSSLLYFINPGSYDDISVQPTMPYNMPPLSREEYDIIKKWIADGAPDKNGNIPFGSNAGTRQKAYLTQQGCDLVGVIDADKKSNHALHKNRRRGRQYRVAALCTDRQTGTLCLCVLYIGQVDSEDRYADRQSSWPAGYSRCFRPVRPAQ